MKTILILVAIMSLVMSGCKDLGGVFGRGGGIKVKKLVPAEVNVARYKKIAILDFDGNGGKQIADWIETDLQNAMVDGKPFFEIFNRSRMLKLLAEQRLALMGFVDPNTAAKIGKLSGSQAIVTGSVSAFRVNDGQYPKDVTRYHGKQQYVERVLCNVRDAYVEFTVSFIDVTTGQVMAQRSAEGQYIGDSCTDDVEGGIGGILAKALTDAIFQSIEKKTDNVKIVRIDAPEKMRKGAATMAIQKFVKQVTPHYVDVNVIILEKDSEGFSISFKSKPENEKQIEANYEVGYKYAVRGQWEDAIAQWEKVLEMDEKRPAAIYNIGLAYEMLGDITFAEKQYKRAADMKAEDVFLDAYARVRKEVAERVKLCEQTGGCGKSPNRQPVENRMVTGQGDSGIGKGSAGTDRTEKKADSPKVIQGSDQKAKDDIESTSTVGKKIIVKETVMLYSKPDSSARTSTKVNMGSEVEQIDKKEDWVKIRLYQGDNPVEGWIQRCSEKGEKCASGKNKDKKPEKKPGNISPM